MINEIVIHSEEHEWNTDHYRIASFDVGSKNLGSVFETRYLDNRKCPIQTESFGLDDIRGDIHYNLTTYLNGILDELKKCHIIMIEKQLHNINHDMTVIEVHMIAYIAVMLRDVPPYPSLYIVDSRLKGDQLGCPKTTDLKTWAKAETKRQLKLQKQPDKLRELGRIREEVHPSDCKVTIEAFFHHCNMTPQHELAPQKFLDELPSDKKKKPKAKKAKGKFNPFKKPWYLKR